MIIREIDSKDDVTSGCDTLTFPYIYIYIFYMLTNNGTCDLKTSKNLKTKKQKQKKIQFLLLGDR